MDFGFDAGQVSFRDAVTGHLGGVLGPQALRQVWEDGQAYDHVVWKGLADLGIGGILVDEEHGGFGGDPVDLLLVLEALGGAAVPEPVVETAVVAPLVIGRFGDPARADRWLPAIAGGDALVAVAHGTHDVLVPDGLMAAAVLVVVDEEVHLVERADVTAVPAAGADPSRRLATCTLGVSAGTLLSRDPEAARLLEAAGATATAALLVGLSQHLATMTRDHLLVRRQFGRSLAEFQVLKHRLADVAVQTEAARSLVWHAGYRLRGNDEETTTAAMMAKAAAGRAARMAGEAALQLHGGIGFTWEHDLHLWLQRGRAWEIAFGRTEQLRVGVGARMLGDA